MTANDAPARDERNGDRRRLHAALAIALFAATLAVFWQVRRFEFVNVDDPQYITENPHVRGGLTARDIAWAFGATKASNWHPLTWLSHMADEQLYGLHAGGHHLTSAIIHALNAALLYLALLGLTRANWKSFFVAALFALHPLRMESVAWVSERKDVLCGLFFVLALWTYTKFARSENRARARRGWYLATLATYALGLMAKPMVVTLPCVLLLLDFWPLRRDANRSVRQLLIEKLPMFAMAFVSCVITMIAQRKGGAVASSEHLPIPIRVGNAIWSYGRYIRKTIWPSDLAAYYPYLGNLPGTSLPWVKVAICAVVLVAITWIVIVAWRRRIGDSGAMLIGWLWFLGMMVPTIGLVQVGGQAMADRYTYLPQIGLLIAIVWGVAALAKKDARALAAVGAVVTLAFAITTSYQLRFWHDSGALWRRALDVTRHNSVANMCMGMWLTEQHRPDEALPYYLEAIRIDPTSYEAQSNVGGLLCERGDLDQAIAHLREAVRLNPRFAQAHNNLANALARRGDMAEAIEHHHRAIELDPDSAQAFYNYGVTLAQIGHVADALRLFERAIVLRPDYVDARYAYALALSTLGDSPAALEQFHGVNTMRPDWPDALVAEAWILATDSNPANRDGKSAVRLAGRACQLTRFSNPRYIDTLAAAYAEAGQFDNATATAEQALALAQSAGQSSAADRIRRRIALYKSHRPYHLSAARAPATAPAPAPASP